MLSICQGSATRRVYRGELVTVDARPGQRTVNQTTLEDYLRGVVPGEVPSGWGSKPNGMEALKAQAVAARSYSAAEKRTGFANTCDSDQCQVYRGRGQFQSSGFDSYEDTRTDRAISDTAGEVRVNPATGAVIRTEFSSSTGGQSAGGDFPPVQDDGDATAANPYRTWTTSISAPKLEAGRRLGAFRGIDVVKRDGVGRYGGRVQNVRLHFALGSVAMTSGEFLRKFNLRSTLFDVQTVERPAGTAAAGATGAALGDSASADGTRASPDAVPAGTEAPPSTAAVGARSTRTAATIAQPKKKKSPATTTLVTAAALAADGRVQAGARARTVVEAAPVASSAPTPTKTGRTAKTVKPR